MATVNGSNSGSLPIIDMRLMATAEDELAKQLVLGLENEGFLYIEGVDVDFAKLYEACQWFFGLDLEKKMKLARQPYNPQAKNLYRGYFPVIEGEASRKEAIEFSGDYDLSAHPHISKDNWMYEHSMYPEEDGTFPFREFIRDYFKKMTSISLDIIRLTAKGLGIPMSAFEDTFRLPVSTLRPIHYPPWNRTSVKPPPNAYSEDGRLITTPDHADSTFLTLLHTFDFDGLEMLDRNGTWRPVPCRKNALIMNIGDTFSRMMNGRFKSTRHRVMDINRERYSVPFFFEPDFYADISIDWISQITGTKKVNESVELYGPWIIKVMKEVKKYAEARFLPEFEYEFDPKKLVGFLHENQHEAPVSGSWLIRDEPQQAQ